MGGLYNVIFGYNPACIVILPMLGRKEDEYPRFRDCFVEDGKIAIYTRVGGNSRFVSFILSWQQEETLIHGSDLTRYSRPQKVMGDINGFSERLF